MQVGQPTIASSARRTIQIAEFVHARLPHLKSVDANLAGSKRRHGQIVSRHSRRRTTSHRRYRIPYRLRLKKNKRVKCTLGEGGEKRRVRKFLRQTKQAFSGNYRLKDNKQIWLPSHIWHSKRMKMANFAGYLVAKYPRARGNRSIFHHIKNKAAFHDASYMNFLQLSGKAADLLLVLKAMTAADCSIFENSMFIHGGRSGEALLYSFQQYPAGCIAPVQFFWCPATSNTNQVRELMLIVSPFAAEALAAEIRDTLARLDGSVSVDVTDCSFSFGYFRLYGPETAIILDKIVAGPSAGASKWRELRKNGLLCHHFPCNAMLAMDLNLQPVHCDTDIACPLSSEQQSIRRHFMQHVDVFERRMQGAAAASTSPVDMSVLAAWCRDSVDATRTHSLCFKEFVWSRKERKADSIPVVAISRSDASTCFGSGVDLLIPREESMRVLTYLMRSRELTAVGTDAVKLVSAAQCRPHFPCDFPDTKGGALYWSERQRRKAAKYSKQRKQYRGLNYKCLNVASPFAPSWVTTSSDSQLPLVIRSKSLTASNLNINLDNAVVMVRVVLHHQQSPGIRGNLVPSTMICAPTADDVECAKSRRLQLVEPLGRSLQAPLRSTLGYVTSVSVTRRESYGAPVTGLGFISLDALASLKLDLPRKSGKSAFVLLRRPSSRRYLTAMLTPLYQE